MFFCIFVISRGARPSNTNAKLIGAFDAVWRHTACSTLVYQTSHYLNQYWRINHWTLEGKLQWNSNPNRSTVCQEDVFDDAIKMAAILNVDDDAFWFSFILFPAPIYYACYALLADGLCPTWHTLYYVHVSKCLTSVEENTISSVVRMCLKDFHSEMMSITYFPNLTF